MSVSIKQSGVLSTVQDWGRYGHQGEGFAPGGPMDEHAFLWANKLLENNYNAPQIEICMGMFACEFTQASSAALCGADTQATLNGNPVGNWRSFNVQKGDLLRCAYAASGMRSYLAVAGGFQVEPILGSAACVCRESIGGLDGRALQVGDEVPFEPQQARSVLVPARYVPSYGKQLSIGVYLTYQYQDFAPEDQKRLLGNAYTVTQDSDRMGMRLSGPILQEPSEVPLSEGIAYGAIQVPASGQPIILAKDRQGIGGYPKIGCVSILDMSQLAQAQAGTQIHFYEQDMAMAIEQLRQRNAFFNIN